MTRPMLCRKGAERAPLAGAWLYERKLDGVRALAGLRAGRPWIESREGADLTARFPEVAAGLLTLPWADCTLDGELVGEGLSAMQWRLGLVNPRAAAVTRAPATLCAFDLLSGGPDGSSFVSAPLEARQALLAAVLTAAPAAARPVEHSPDGPAMWARAQAERWEGLVAKRPGSRYRPGARTDAWVKVKPAAGRF